MQIKGIKRGNFIEISENPNIPDGSEVLLEVGEVSLLVDSLLEKAKELTQVSAELTEIIANIEKERQIEQPQNFWEAIQKFRQENNLEAAGIEAEIFDGVRDSSPGREVIL